MLPIQRKISAYNHYDTNKQMYLVIHYVGAQSSTALNNVTYFFNGDRQASAHYFVDDNSIWQSVEDYCGAWHVGNSVTAVNNKNSIGIEMCCMGANLQVTTATENNTLDLAEYLCKKYNITIDRVKTHAEVTNYGKICPNWSASNWSRWNTFKSKLKQRLEGKKVDVIYEAHVEGIGWQGQRANGATAGTTGQRRRLEALSVSLSDANLSRNIRVSGHIEGIGDIAGLNIVGTTGQALRLESIKIDSPVRLLYRVHQANIGWTNWVNSGQWCGIKGKSLRIEAVEIKIA